MARRWAAVAGGLAMLLAACSGEQGGQPRPESTGPRRSFYAGPKVHPAGPNPLGFKWDWPRVDRYVPFLTPASGGATFFELVWCDVEPRPGKRDWGRVDEVARSADALGYSLFLKIRVGSCWATNGRGGHQRRAKTASALPTDMGAYEEFVRSAVTRYSARGVQEYAVENEVNAPIMWDGTPEEYRRLVEAAARAVHAASPEAKVLDGGVSSTAYGVAIASRLLDQGQADQAVAAYQRWYARRVGVRSETFPAVADAGGLRAVLADDQPRRDLAFVDASVGLARDHVVDAWQAHFYERWDNVDTLLAHLRSVLPAGMAVEAWEVGLFWPDHVGDRRAQAAEAAKLAAKLLGGGVTRLIWLPLAYNPAGRHDSEIRFGLLDPDGTVRPAGRALLDMAQASQGATIRPLRGAGVSGVAFDRRGRSVVVAWSDAGATLAGPAPAGADARDVEGRPRPWPQGGLTLGPEPVQLQGPPALDALVP